MCITKRYVKIVTATVQIHVNSHIAVKLSVLYIYTFDKSCMCGLQK